MQICIFVLTVLIDLHHFLHSLELEKNFERKKAKVNSVQPLPPTTKDKISSQQKQEDSLPVVPSASSSKRTLKETPEAPSTPKRRK